MSAPVVFAALVRARRSTKRFASAALTVGFEPQEETLTEYFLSRMPGAVHVKAHSRPHESKVSGADWEWWWTDGRTSVGMLLQAKRRKKKGRLYEFDYKPKKSPVRQIDRLIAHAHKRGLSPVYVLYDVGPRPALLAKACPGLCPESLAVRSSIAIVGASVAKRYASTPAKVPDHAMPVECLACSFRASGRSGGSRPLPAAVLSAVTRWETDGGASDFADSNRLGQFVVDGLPDYVLDILDSVDVDEKLDERGVIGLAVFGPIEVQR